METQRAVVEYFRDLALALNEQQEKGTPKGDPRVQQDIYQTRQGHWANRYRT
jgi:hypothetical protein